MSDINVRFLSLSSGSSGNCYFLGRFDGEDCLGGILIDAGVSLKRLKSILSDHGLSIDDFGAVLITRSSTNRSGPRMSWLTLCSVELSNWQVSERLS